VLAAVFRRNRLARPLAAFFTNFTKTLQGLCHAAVSVRNGKPLPMDECALLSGVTISSSGSDEGVVEPARKYRIKYEQPELACSMAQALPPFHSGKRRDRLSEPLETHPRSQVLPSCRDVGQLVWIINVNRDNLKKKCR